jgi:glycosyltransferase involved in cell wall biosynthesis
VYSINYWQFGKRNERLVKIETPLVSVIIPNYNYGNYISETLSSVLNQSYKNLEIIVVDDGSTDNSIEVIKRLGQDIRIIEQNNSGVSSARNKGLKASTGKYVCFLDADDFWEEHKVELQVMAAEEYDLDLIYCGYSECDVNLNIIKEQIPKHKGNCENLYRVNPGSAIALLGTSTAMIRATVLEKVEGFDIELNTSADWDFLRRISKISHFSFVSAQLVRYRIHSDSMSSGSLVRYYRDNELALNKMIAEYSSKNFKDFFLNRYSVIRFHLGAMKAFLKSRELMQSFRHLTKMIFGVISVK